MWSRNDDHGGNNPRRMQIAINGLLEQLERFRVESELILVDWNPPSDKPLLKNAIRWPSHRSFCTIRIIEVPPSIHQRYRYHEKIPVHSPVAINCGIRRSRGEFILLASVGLLYSDDVINFIASKALKKGCIYRIDRCDVDRDVVKFNTLKEQLDYSQDHIIRINSKPQIGAGGCPPLHTNAGGDFQLMSKQDWYNVRGYREEDIAAAHADSLLSYSAYAAGIKEVILDPPCYLYHIDHDEGFNEQSKLIPSPIETWISSHSPRIVGQKLNSFIYRFRGDKTKCEIRGVPTYSHSEIVQLCKKMVTKRRPYFFNGEVWGLEKEILHETVISKGTWE